VPTCIARYWRARTLNGRRRCWNIWQSVERRTVLFHARRMKARAAMNALPHDTAAMPTFLGEHDHLIHRKLPCCDRNGRCRRPPKPFLPKTQPHGRLARNEVVTLYVLGITLTKPIPRNASSQTNQVRLAQGKRCRLRSARRNIV